MFSRAPGVQGARSGMFFDKAIFFTETIKLFYWSNCQNDRLELPYVVKKHNFARCGRAARAKRISPMKGSYGSQDGSNELSHAQFRARESEIARTKHLLLYRWLWILDFSTDIKFHKLAYILITLRGDSNKQYSESGNSYYNLIPP